jgi:hypothetical protein
MARDGWALALTHEPVVVIPRHLARPGDRSTRRRRRDVRGRSRPEQRVLPYLRASRRRMKRRRGGSARARRCGRRREARPGQRRRHHTLHPLCRRLRALRLTLSPGVARHLPLGLPLLPRSAPRRRTGRRARCRRHGDALLGPRARPRRRRSGRCEPRRESRRRTAQRSVDGRRAAVGRDRTRLHHAASPRARRALFFRRRSRRGARRWQGAKRELRNAVRCRRLRRRVVEERRRREV